MHLIKREKGRCSRTILGRGERHHFFGEGRSTQVGFLVRIFEDFRERFNSFGEGILEAIFFILIKRWLCGLHEEGWCLIATFFPPLMVAHKATLSGRYIKAAMHTWTRTSINGASTGSTSSPNHHSNHAPFGSLGSEHNQLEKGCQLSAADENKHKRLQPNRDSARIIAPTQEKTTWRVAVSGQSSL